MPQKDDFIRLRVSAELKRQAETLATTKGMNLADLVRYLLAREIESNK